MGTTLATYYAKLQDMPDSEYKVDKCEWNVDKKQKQIITFFGFLNSVAGYVFFSILQIQEDCIEPGDGRWYDGAFFKEVDVQLDPETEP